MSEGEIINRLNYDMKNANCNWGKSCIVDNKDLKGLLDLYNKEKEKNKELEMQLLEKDLHIDGLKEDRRITAEEIQEEYYISKDKMKKVIDSEAFEVITREYGNLDVVSCDVLLELLVE